MNNTFFQKNKRVISIVAAIIAFAAITLVYFSPILEGKRLKQHDVEAWRGAAQETIEYRETTGQQTLWTNSMFGGMPTWNISAPAKSNLFMYVDQLLTLKLPSSTGTVFISMLGCFVLLLLLDCGLLISFIGAIAYGFSSYLFIVIGAGHATKAAAMSYMAPLIAAILLTYRGKYLWGSLMTAFVLALEIRVNHLQITYYLLIICIILVIAQLISDIREKQLGRFFKASAGLLVAVVFAILTSTTMLYSNYEYGKETTRGKPVLTGKDNNQTNGLDRDYITQWSYGIGETWSLLIPNAKGGASAYIGRQNPALEKADGRFKDSIAQSSAYWGDQPFTSGPVYVGAIVVFLFLLGVITVKGKLKWALLAATLLSILLSWGKNFMGFTDFFIDHVPGYNKFRAVSMTLVIAELCIPVLGFLGLAEITKSPENLKTNLKKLYIAFGITAGFCLLFYLMPKTFFSFLSQGEAEQFAQLSSGKDGAVYQSFAEQLQAVRVAIFRKDAIRSFLFIILASVPVFLNIKGKLKATPAFALLGALILFDMYPIDKRYLNNDNFVSKKQSEKPFTTTAADNFILADKTLDFRVINLTKDVFNDASTSYFHKSVGGYHGAKMRRYQDLINQYLGQEVRQFNSIFKNASTEADLAMGLRQQKVLNMLNTKYIIYNPEAQPLLNPEAFGNAWMVNSIKWVDNANDEFDAIGSTDLRHEAVLNKEFEEQLIGFAAPDSISGQIELTEYKPNQLAYSFHSDRDQLVVFSEIWSGLDGWHMQIDGNEHPILRANYLLRAALIPSGQHEIVMRYEPKIWNIGRVLTFSSSALILVGAFLAIILSLKKKQA